MIEIWIFDSGGRRRPGPRFRAITDALRFVRAHETPRQLGVRLADGRWYDLEQNSPATNRRRHRRVPLARRGSIVLADERREIGSDIIVLDGSLGGFRARVVSADVTFCPGWRVHCSLITNQKRLTMEMVVRWVDGRLLGLELIDKSRREQLGRWISDVSGVNTPTFGVRVIEKRRE